MMDVSGLKINMRAPFFQDHLMPDGFLTRDMACHACWYYYILATNARHNVGNSIDDQTIEYNAESMTDIPLWRDKRFNQQAKSIALLYGLESPDEMWKYWPNVKMEARRLNLTPPHDEIMNLSGHDRIT